MPDIEQVAQYVEEALDELLEAAGRPPGNGRSRKRGTPATTAS
jgi:hypothetical protein